MKHNATTLAQYMTTPNRLEASFQLRSRAYQWAAACSDTTDLLRAFEMVQWANHLHAAECATSARRR